MSATNSGEVMVPLMASAMVGAVVSGMALKRTGHKLWSVLEPLVAAFGLFLLSTLNGNPSTLAGVCYLMVTGLGQGMVMSNYIVAAQNFRPRRRRGWPALP